MISHYLTRFVAHELTRHCGEGVERLFQILSDICVDLNLIRLKLCFFVKLAVKRENRR